MITFEAKYIWEFLPKLIVYLPVTLLIWFLSVFFALIIGMVISVIRLKRIPVLTEIIRVILSFVRGTPVLTQLFMVYYGLPLLLQIFYIDISRIDGMYFVILTYTLHYGAAVSENLRAAFASVGKGQSEAAYAIGMTGLLAFRRVVFPQAMLVAIPNFSNIFIGALKNTSLAFSVGVIELLSKGQKLGGTTYHFLESYIALAIIYYILYLILAQCFKIVERKVTGKIRI